MSGTLECTHGQCASVLDAELRRLSWTKHLSEAALSEFIHTARVATFDAGEHILEMGSDVTHAFFVVTGSVQVVLNDSLGKEVYRGGIGRGGVVGLLAMAARSNSQLSAHAIEPTIAIALSLDELLDLGSKHRDFQATLLHLASSLFAQVVSVERRVARPGTVAIIHHSQATRTIARALTTRLRDINESPCVLGDDESLAKLVDVPFQLIAREGVCISEEERRRTIKEWAARGRLIIDLSASTPRHELVSLLNYAETVLWCVRPEDAQDAAQALRGIEHEVQWVRDKVCLVWLLSGRTKSSPFVAELQELARRDFKLSLDTPTANEGMQFRFGLERVVHFLRGIQVGLALGGGAARGMAHLGVLKALEKHGIVVDRIAGTSAGAMTGTVYAHGMSPEYCISCFKNDLQPSWFFRQLPAGGYWYLLYKYRRNLFDAMLRKYLADRRLEQLAVPMTTIAVDLVEGETLVRTDGDATINILESINLPPLSLPIFAGGRALVDGGLLNNVPANVLVEQGCNFVIASSVTAKLEQDFMGIRAHGRPKASRFFSTLQVIMRQNMIQSYKMNSVGVQPADFVIAPDVTRYDISQFTKADEMAEIGENTVDEMIERLRALLCRMDAELFRSPLSGSAT